MSYPDADEFDDIYVQPNENLTWDVIGRSTDYYNNTKFKTLEEGVRNKALAEAFIRWYTENYWKRLDTGVRDD